jgi:UDP-N-acetylglucosamine 1-carboxyvinyltransferase
MMGPTEDALEVHLLREYLLVEGGRRLSGRVRASAAKNAVLPMMAAAILAPGESVLRQAPNLSDVGVMGDILRSLGAEVTAEPCANGLDLAIQSRHIDNHVVPDALMGELRSSIFLMGALLGRLGRARLAYPGGCPIGPRPIDLHLLGLRALGARIEERFGLIEARADRLTGADIHLDLPSVGATENIMLAAVMAEGRTVIRNPAKEPEIVDLARMLNSMGASVHGAGMDAIVIEGPTQLRATEYHPIPDRIEAGTLLLSGAVTGGEVEVWNVVPEHFRSLLAKLREAGLEVVEGPDYVRVNARGNRPRSFDCKTAPYPGFPTDLQPPLMILATLAEGTSVISETIYERRFNHAEELRRMGANIKVEGRSAIIKGVAALSGARVRAHDLRAGAALVLAGLAAEGVTAVSDVGHIDRGYDCLERKLTALGAVIRRQVI